MAAEAFAGLDRVLGALTAPLAATFGAIKDVFSQARSHVDALSKAASTQGKALEKTTSATSTLGSAFAKLQASVDQLSAHLRGVVLPGDKTTSTSKGASRPAAAGAAPAKGAQSILPGGKGGAGGAGGAAEAAEGAGALEGIGAAAGALVAGVGIAVGAIAALAAGINTAVSAMGPFVEALSPGTMIAFSIALKNLQAAIGVAFQPVFQALTGTFQEMNRILTPIMGQLRPIFGMLGDMLGTVLVRAAESLAGAVRPLVPLFTFITGLAKGLVDIWSTLNAVSTALVETVLGSIFGDMQKDIGGVMAQLRKAVHEASKAILSFAVGIARMFGATKFIDNLIKTLTPKEGPGTQAAGQTSIKGLTDIAKDLALAAAQAGGGVNKDEEARRMQEELLETVKNAASGKLVNPVVKAIEDIAVTVSDAFSWIKRTRADIAAGWSSFKTWLADHLPKFPGFGR